MKVPNDELTDHIVEILNKAIEMSPKCMYKLFENRVGCSKALANDPTHFQVHLNGGFPEIGLLGIINAITGGIELSNGAVWGSVTAHYTGDGKELLRVSKTDSEAIARTYGADVFVVTRETEE